MAPSIGSSDRRAFLRFLAASPLLASAGFTSRWFAELLSAPVAAQDGVLVKSVREALNLFDFRTAAKATLSVAHFTEFDEGVFNEETLRANREAFTRYQVKMRRLLGIGNVDQSASILRGDVGLPALSVSGGQAASDSSRRESCRGAGRQQNADSGGYVRDQDLEHVNQLRGQPVRIGVAGNGPNQDEAPITRSDSMNEVMGALDSLRGADTATWTDVERVRDMTKMKSILKGIVAREDGELAVKNGVDAIMVSNPTRVLR